MTDYTKLVEALRFCFTPAGKGCGYCPAYGDTRPCRIGLDAADAIVELQQIAAHYEQSAKDYWKEACEYKAQLPKRGEWEREMDVNDEPFYQCSVCGECFDFNSDSTHEVFNYCPNCGADMRKMEVQE